MDWQLVTLIGLAIKTNDGIVSRKLEMTSQKKKIIIKLKERKKRNDKTKGRKRNKKKKIEQKTQKRRESYKYKTKKYRKNK